MPELTRAEIIKQDKISKQSFLHKAEAAEGQAKHLIAEAKRLRNAAQIAREHWEELEREE